VRAGDRLQHGHGEQKEKESKSKRNLLAGDALALIRWDSNRGAGAGGCRHNTGGVKKKERKKLGQCVGANTLGMGRLVVAVLGEPAITALGGLVIAVLGAGHQDTGGAGDRPCCSKKTCWGHIGVNMMG